MPKRKLKNLTLLGIDCVDLDRLAKAAAICQTDFEFGAVKLLTSLETAHPAAVKIPPIRSLEEYSRFIIKKLNDYVATNFVLVFHFDSFILNPSAWTDRFLDYDYIGAPWWYTDGMNVGNGGFSIRSKKLLALVQSDPKITELHPEDHVICRVYRHHLEEHGITFAPDDLAARFCIEGIPLRHKPDADNVWRGQFAFHALQKTDISAWLKNHPEASWVENNVKPGLY